MSPQARFANADTGAYACAYLYTWVHVNVYVQTRTSASESLHTRVCICVTRVCHAFSPRFVSRQDPTALAPH
jgi:hypothetical protein